MRNWFVLLITFFFINALAEDKKPEIKGQRALSTDQGKPITIQLADLIVQSNDSKYPNGYFVEIFDGVHYNFSGNTITPNADFSGILEVEIRITDGKKNKSKKFRLKITVRPNAYENKPPVIIGQVPLSTNQNESLTVTLSQLVVTDPDNKYPGDFTLRMEPGTNYSITGSSIIPLQNFVGTLTVNVKVNDGKNDSPIFGLKVQVIEVKTNVKPVITSQVPLSTPKNKTLAIQLSQITVTDPDNNFPSDFQLTVLSGNNYLVIANAISPAKDYTGTLSVGITVTDGKAVSDIFYLKIEVVEVSTLQITGHKALVVLEDSTIILSLTDLIVNDPNQTFPTGFTMRLAAGENYIANGLQITPAKNYFGNLRVPVQVERGSESSPPYNILIVVTPVNDPPELSWDTRPMTFTPNKGGLKFSSDANITDVDDKALSSAEVGISYNDYQKGNDKLGFSNTENVKGIFDSDAGILYLIGVATLEEYQRVLQSLQYDFKSLGDTLPATDKKVVYIKLNDGKISSQIYQKEITMMEDVPLEIPTGFTPNNDNANDTWYIKPLGTSEVYEDAVIRVFTRHGVKVFEATGFEKEWDGRLNGDLLPADSYFYTIELNSPFRKINKSGVVTLLR